MEAALRAGVNPPRAVPETWLVHLVLKQALFGLHQNSFGHAEAHLPNAHRLCASIGDSSAIVPKRRRALGTVGAFPQVAI